VVPGVGSDEPNRCAAGPTAADGLDGYTTIGIEKKEGLLGV
jgi:hypothetical protein